MPGPFDPDTGTVLWPPNLPGWGEVPLRAWLEDALGLPVHLENDANAAALAEWRFGAGRGARHLVYLTMSTGVGGGLMLDGRLYRGVRAGAGELGHVQLVSEGELCGCGLRGCAEAYLGGASLGAAPAHASPPPDEPRCGRWPAAAGRRRRATSSQRPARETRFALAEMERFNHYLARLLSIAAFALAPELVVLGTIAVAAGDALCFEPVRRELASLTWPALTRDLRVVPAGLGAELAAHAALAAAWEGARR